MVALHANSWQEFGWQNERKKQKAKQGIYCRCADCDDIISNPICPECLMQQMQIFLNESNPQLAKEVISNVEIEGDIKCLSCGKGMGLCAHCFSKSVYEILNDKDQNLAEEFLSRFDFDIRESMIEDELFGGIKIQKE
ncbi:hypothetical protein HN385_02675 [archaeon]|nr:hypothetical protein [archaeon]MBT3450655.1 hypothetical protein [archaeon]MBT6868765.1 hypothetical protein [archaeon]MBT7193014.1 hypothetical protein [archaeon]MBT7380980.1 hypothetical protein [archaeon]